MSPHRIASLLALSFAIVLALTACGGQDSHDGDFLFVEPCVPAGGSEVDPCHRDPYWGSETGSQASYTKKVIPKLPIDLFARMRFLSEFYDIGQVTPQFYVRGTWVPGSSRCVKATVITLPAEISTGKPLISGKAGGDGSFDYNCFADLRVNEYLNGDGPETLPILITWGRASEDETSPSYEAFREVWPVVTLGIEGKEMIVVLRRPLDIAVGAWGWVRVAGWDVQRREDGEVVVVSAWAGTLGVADPSEWEYTLEEFRPMVKDAMARFRTWSGGRVGRHPSDPEFAPDANGASLIENLRAYGAFSVDDVTPAPAPTVPGETDPDPYGYSVNEDTMTAAPEVPGGLEGTATPISALGDEPTATATVEPTATATVEPTVTPEPVPTPELEDTPTPEAEAAPTATPEPVPTPEPEPTATAMPEPVVDPTATPEPVVEPTATATAESVVEPPATATPEPVIEPTATPEDVVATDTPEPEVPGPDGPGEVVPPGGEGPVGGGPDGPDSDSVPDG